MRWRVDWGPSYQPFAKPKGLALEDSHQDTLQGTFLAARVCPLAGITIVWDNSYLCAVSPGSMNSKMRMRLRSVPVVKTEAASLAGVVETCLEGSGGLMAIVWGP